MTRRGVIAFIAVLAGIVVSALIAGHRVSRPITAPRDLPDAPLEPEATPATSKEPVTWVEVACLCAAGVLVACSVTLGLYVSQVWPL